jgi:hypothetical protein
MVEILKLLTSVILSPTVLIVLALADLFFFKKKNAYGWQSLLCSVFCW